MQRNRTLAPLAIAVLALLCWVAPAFAAAPAGSWWDTNYSYRQQISIPTGGAALTAPYALSVTFNHASEVAAGRSLTSGNDVRILRWTGTAWVELDRIPDADTTWNTSSTRIWFRIPTTIAASPAIDDNYYVYFGNPSALTPPQNTANIFLLYDPFTSTTLNTTYWGKTGTVTLSGGLATFSSAARLRAKAGYTFGTNTIWEARVKLSASVSTFYYWGTSSTSNYTSSTANYLVFIGTATQTAKIKQGTPTSSATITGGSPTTSQLYAFTREPAQARFFVNSSVVATLTTGLPTASLRALMRNDAGAGQTLQYDWVRIRQYRNPEPGLTLAGREQYATTLPTAIAEWRMEQAAWSGTAGEVTDSGPNGLNMQSKNGANTASTTPATSGEPGTCRYGVFDGTNDYVEVADNAVLDLSSQVSVSAWIYPRNAYNASGYVVAKGTNYGMRLDATGHVVLTWGSTSYTSTGTVPLNGWSHIAVSYASGSQIVYINGVASTAGTSAAALTTNASPLQIGQSWNGYVDEVRIYGTTLTVAQVALLKNATHPCTGAANHFIIEHDGYGINCVGESVKVTVVDAGDIPVTTYTQQVTLDTTMGRGTWSLTSGSGTFSDATAEDGIATYTWPSGQSSATFSLNFRSGSSAAGATGNLSFDIAVYQTSNPTLRDDSSAPTMQFSPSGFTVTSAVLSNPPPGTIPAFASPQTAGTDVSIYIAAYGQTPTDSQCGIIEAYDGTQQLQFWTTYVNPSSGTVKATVDGNDIETSEAASDALADAQDVDFTSGQAVVTLKYKDVGSLSIGLKDDSGHPDLPNGIRGSLGPVVFKPSTFALSNIRRTDTGAANPAATDANGAVFMAAGRPFSVTVTATDAEGSATPNYGKESPAESVALTAALVSPTGGTNPAIVAPIGFGSFTNGVATGTDFSWSEVGIITLTPRVADSGYLTGGNVTGTTSGNVGRFTPYDFSLAVTTSPTFQTACTSGGFSYVGQPLAYSIAPVLTATARSASTATTQNYTGTFYKLTTAALSGRTTYTSTAGSLLLAPPANDPTSTSLGSGQGRLNYATNPGLSFNRTTAVAPFTPQITLNLALQDADGVAVTSTPYLLPSSGGIAFPMGAQQRYGRVVFRNAVGSELVDLVLPMRAEFYVSDTSGFATNTSDVCTTGITFSLGGYTGNLSAGETSIKSVAMPPSAGDFNLRLQAPGTGNQGTVKITATVPTWLQFDWDPTTPVLENPSGTATFGIYQGNPRRVYTRERY